MRCIAIGTDTGAAGTTATGTAGASSCAPAAAVVRVGSRRGRWLHLSRSVGFVAAVLLAVPGGAAALRADCMLAPEHAATFRGWDTEATGRWLTEESCYARSLRRHASQRASPPAACESHAASLAAAAASAAAAAAVSTSASAGHGERLKSP